MMEEYLVTKKLHLKEKGSSLLATNFLKYVRPTFLYDADSNCFEVNDIEYESKLEQSDHLSDNVISDGSLKEIRIKNRNRIVLADLNINSLRIKFDILTGQITINVDVLVISETKLDDSIPESQFKIRGYSFPFRLDRTEHKRKFSIKDFFSKYDQINSFFCSVRIRTVRESWYLFARTLQKSLHLLKINPLKLFILN